MNELDQMMADEYSQQEEPVKGKRVVNGVEIETFSKLFPSACVLECEVGTNGIQGGDTGHGGRTYFRLRNVTSTDMNVKVVGVNGQTEEVEMEMGGDCELEMFAEALEFAAEILRRQC